MYANRETIGKLNVPNSGLPSVSVPEDVAKVLLCDIRAKRSLPSIDAFYDKNVLMSVNV